MDFSIENYTHIQNTQCIVPVQAFITYRNININGDQEYVIAKHEFDRNTKDEFVLGDAKLLSLKEQHEIANIILNKKSQNNQNELIQENILALYADGLSWFIKAKKWTMRFNIGGKVRVFKIPMPPHVVSIKGHDIRLYAVKKNTRPTKSTPLYVSPIPNVYQNNKLCSGSVSFPKSASQRDIPDIEQGIFTTVNTHSHTQSIKGIKLKKHVNFLVTLQDKDHFSVQKMIPIGKNLGEVV